MKKKTTKSALSQKTTFALLGLVVLIAAVVWFQRGGISADENRRDVSLTNIEPATGTVGTEVLVRGSGFSLENNTVTIGSVTRTGLSSSDGTSILMYIPQDLQEGNHTVSVKNTDGQSNSQKFQVTK